MTDINKLLNDVADLQHQIRIESAKTFTPKQVQDIIAEVFDYYKVQRTNKRGMDFEKFLNDKGLNGNNGDNVDRYEEEFEKQQIESFI